MGSKYVLSDDDLAKVAAAALWISRDYKYHFSIPFLSVKVDLNEKKLKAGFKQLYQTGPYQFLVQIRMENAVELLHRGYSVAKVAVHVGYTGDHAATNFIRAFKRHFGKSPDAWIKGHHSHPFTKAV